MNLKAEPDAIPVYLEQRASQMVRGYKVTGKYDIILEGTVEDFKSTKVYTYMMGSNDDKQILQGSIYRFLAPDKITNDFMKIQYIFTDWKAMEAKRDPKNYPQEQSVEVVHQLMSVPETRRYIGDKIGQLENLMDAPESEMPPCSDEDLWRTETKWKYYKKAVKFPQEARKILIISLKLINVNILTVT